MKIETREVTVTKNVYIAADGREFDNDVDCEDYEFKLLENSLLCYDCEYDRTTIERSTFVNLVTDDDVRNFKIASGIVDSSVDGISGPGLYMYVDDYTLGRWVNLDEVISRIRGGVQNDQT